MHVLHDVLGVPLGEDRRILVRTGEGNEEWWHFSPQMDGTEASKSETTNVSQSAHQGKGAECVGRLLLALLNIQVSYCYKPSSCITCTRGCCIVAPWPGAL